MTGYILDMSCIVLWHTELMGWIVFREKSIEKTAEFEPVYETDVADFTRLSRSSWT
jgi:hypothetical protein